MGTYDKDWQRSSPQRERDDRNEESDWRRREREASHDDFDDDRQRSRDWDRPSYSRQDERDDRNHRSSGQYGPGQYGAGGYAAGRNAGQTRRGRFGYGARSGYGAAWYDRDDEPGYRSGRFAEDRGDSRYFTGSQGSWAVGPVNGGVGRYGDDYRRQGYDDDHSERGFFERAGDEIASWFGDEDAQRRRDQDHRGRGPSDYTRSDERIREDVNDRLTEDRLVDASRVSVAVANGEVTLSGTVRDRAAKRRAEDCADDVSGVRHVQNNLRVESISAATGSGGTDRTISGSNSTTSAGIAKSGTTTNS